MPELLHVWRTSVQPFSSFLMASVLPPAAETLPSVQTHTYVRFLTFLYWLLSLLYFHTFSVTYFSYFAVTYFFFINSCAFSCCLSFLLPDEASGRNGVNTTVFFSAVCCCWNYYTSILFGLHKCRNFFFVAHFRAAILVFFARFGAAGCRLLAATLPSIQLATFIRFLTFLQSVAL